MANEIRLVIIGDELAAGRGDPRGQGWAGRIVARADTPASVTAYPLAVPGENTTALAGRWEAEASLRFAANAPNRLMIGLGWADMLDGVSVARARLNLATILDRAATLGVPTMVVGPPPRLPEDEPQLDVYSRAYAEAAARRDTPYVEMLAPLANHAQWLADMRASGGTWPGQDGYGLMAWLVLHNNWNSWISEG